MENSIQSYGADCFPASSNHLIGPHQHVGRNRQADLLGGLQIDHKLELRRLLNGKIRGLGAFKDFVDVEGSATFADLDVPKRRAA